MTVRPATPEDLPQIQAIFEYYVQNTVVSFLVKDPPSDYIKTRYEAALERQLPYLVAVEDDGSGQTSVIGYAYAGPFRGYMLGYGHTVEMSIFCHPNHKQKGAGSALMAAILKALETARHRTYEAGHEEESKEFTIKNIMAIMAVDETALGKGLVLRDWYQKWGFEQVGRLKGVGYKLGRTAQHRHNLHGKMFVKSGIELGGSIKPGDGAKTVPGISVKRKPISCCQ